MVRWAVNCCYFPALQGRSRFSVDRTSSSACVNVPAPAPAASRRNGKRDKAIGFTRFWLREIQSSKERGPLFFPSSALRSARPCEPASDMDDGRLDAGRYQFVPNHSTEIHSSIPSVKSRVNAYRETCYVSPVPGSLFPSATLATEIVFCIKNDHQGHHRRCLPQSLHVRPHPLSCI